MAIELLIYSRAAQYANRDLPFDRDGSVGRSEHMLQTFQNFIEKTQLSVYKLASITTDGEPVMVGCLNGFIIKCRQKDAFPDFLNRHCIIHQQAVCDKMLNMKEIVDVATKIVPDLFKDGYSMHIWRVWHTELSLHTDVRWLSRGKFLQRFWELCPEIKDFFSHVAGYAEYKQLIDGQWLLDFNWSDKHVEWP